MLAAFSPVIPLLRRITHIWEMVRPMIIKRGKFVSFAPVELQERPAGREQLRPQRTVAQAPLGTPSRGDVLHEIDRLVRENERLTLERDQLREEISRQSLEARRKKLFRQRSKKVAESVAPQPLAPAPSAPEPEVSDPKPEAERDAGYELARVVVNWFWEDADEASVRLVHDALAGQGIRTLVREADAESD